MMGHHNGLFILAFHIHSYEIQWHSLDNPHEHSQIIHCWKDDELLYQNILDLLGFIWILITENMVHLHFPLIASICITSPPPPPFGSFAE